MINCPAAVFFSEKNEIVVIGGGKIEIYNELPYPLVNYKQATDLSNADKYKDLRGNPLYLERIERNKIEFASSYSSFSEDIQIPVDDYILEVAKYFPDSYEKLNISEELYPMFFDIETRSTEDHFPNPERDDIISIQVKYPDTEPIILLQEEEDDSDKELLEKFKKYCIKSPTGKTPDFLVGYSLIRFDNPFILERLRKHRIQEDWIRDIYKARYPGIKGYSLFSAKWMNPKRKKVGRKDSTKDTIVELIPGLYSIDLYELTKPDYELRSLPNKRMKTVLEYLNCPFLFDIPIEKKKNMKELIEKEYDVFIKYATSDVLGTEYLYNHYEPSLIANTNLFKVPVTMVYNMRSGQRAYLLAFRETMKNGFFSLESNESRHYDLYSRAPKYQGALVGCLQKGYFPRILYLDATSMYPNIIHDFNLSFDSIKYNGVIPFRNWNKPIQITVEDNKDDPSLKEIFIPDNNYKCVLHYTCDFHNSGYMRKLMKDMMDIRNKYKDLANEYSNKFKESNNVEDSSKATIYKSLDQAQKIATNSIYGLFGTKFYEIGDLPIAIFITAIGRWIMENMLDYFGEAVIEIDTDGAILNRDHLETEDVDVINKLLLERIEDKFSIPKEHIRFNLKFEDHGSVYIYKMKNYIFLPEGETDPTKMVIKGSAFRGYDKAPVVLQATRIMCESTMNVGEYGNLSFEKASQKALDIYNLPMDMFKFTKTLKRTIDEYKGSESIYSFINRLPEEVTNNTKKLKKEVIGWLQDNKADRINDRYLRAIKSTTSESSLWLAINMIADDNKDIGNNKHFVVSLMNRRIASGKGANVDDIIEYYFSRKPEKFTLHEEIESFDDIDIQKYERAISNVIDIFSYADNTMEEFNIF